MEATTLLPHLARDSAEPMRRALKQYDPAKIAIRGTEALLRTTLRLQDGLFLQWGETRSLLADGLDGQTARLCLRASLEAFQEFEALLLDVLAFSQSAERREGRPLTGAAEAEALRGRVREQSAEARSLLDFVNRPAPPFDAHKLVEARRSYEEGDEGEDMRTTGARLRAGGEP